MPNDLQGRGGASNVCTGPLVFFKRSVALLGELFVSLEVPGQNGMVSRDSPLTQAASTCKLDALVM